MAVSVALILAKNCRFMHKKKVHNGNDTCVPHNGPGFDSSVIRPNVFFIFSGRKRNKELEPVMIKNARCSISKKGHKSSSLSICRRTLHTNKSKKIAVPTTRKQNPHESWINSPKQPMKAFSLTDFSEDILEDRVELDDAGEALGRQAAAADGLLRLEHQRDGDQLLERHESKPGHQKLDDLEEL